MKTRTRMCTAAAVSYAALWSTLSFAGPITPPPGPVAATHKTLSEVEPRVAINETNTPGDADSLFKITQPGSYYLAGNITGVVGKHGIEIAASGVTIDLNGFDLAGVAGMGAFDGVTVNTTGSVCVRNGSVRDWGDCGIDVLGTIGSVITDVRVSGCTTIGISGSYRTAVRNCVAISNLDIGIRVWDGCVVDGCIASLNGTHGIDVGSSCLITRNNCTNNGKVGDGAGIRVWVGSLNRIEDNHCTGADRGISVLNGRNIILRNTCTTNVVNWVIVEDNIYGPIIDRTATVSGGVYGNSASSTLGSTDPNANFSF